MDEKPAAHDRAVEQWRRAFELDRHYTASTVECACNLIDVRRFEDARRERQNGLGEKRATIPADWAAPDAPRARKLLESIRAHQ